MQITALSSGPVAPMALDALISINESRDTPTHDVICVTNNWHDYGFGGLRICPDLDDALSVLTGTPQATSKNAVWALQGWEILSRHEAHSATDFAIAAAIARNLGAASGATIADVAAQQLASAHSDATLLPVSLDPVELHVIESTSQGQRGRHVRSWLADTERSEPLGFAGAGLDQATPAPGVLDAIRTSDVVLLLPMHPVLDAAGLLGVAGIRDALRGTTATVVGLSHVGLPQLRDEAATDMAYKQAELEASSPQLAQLFGDFLDRLIIDESEPAGSYRASLDVRRAPMTAALTGDEAARDALRQAVLS